MYAIDASSSMGSSHGPKAGKAYVKIEGVKRGITQAVTSGAFPFGSRVGVVTFHAPTRALGLLLASGQEMVEQVLPLTAVEDLAKGEMLQSALSKIQVSGATPSGIAISKGIELLGSDEPSGVKRIKKLVLVTDERSNVGPRPEKVVDERVARQVILDIVAVGGRTNERTLAELASRTGGRFVEADSEAELLEALRPGISVRKLGSDAALIEGAQKSADELSRRDRSSLDFRQTLERARQERAKLNKRLMELLISKDISSREIAKLVEQVSSGPDGQKISMKEYAERVWPRASELPQLEMVEAELRRAMDSLAV